MSGHALRAVCIILALCAPALAQRPITVRDPTGAPLVGVYVIPEYRPEQQPGGLVTDDEGHVDVGSAKSVRFEKIGYRSRTVLMSELSEAEVILQSPQEIWRASKCPGAPRSWLRRMFSRSRVYGDHMRFTLAPGMRARRGYDIDYGFNTICLGDQCLMHGFGPMWSIGYQTGSTYFSGVRELVERDMFDPNLDTVFGAEYRGTRIDGTRFRWAGVYGESIGYDHVTDSTATRFDAIIDSLCWFDVP